MAQVTPRPVSKCTWLETTPEKLETAGCPSGKLRQMVIALTGGPCSGKSSILAIIRDRLSKRGMQVVTVPEYATHFFGNSDGFQAEWIGNASKEEALQDILLRFQVSQENMFREYAALNVKPSVLLLDRAVMDQKVFTSERVWHSVLDKNSITEEQLLGRYDMIMHLGTCAGVGDYEWGPNSNNPGRYHTPEEAAKLDKTCEKVYQGHKQLRIVPHCGKFEEKVEMVMKYLEDALGVDGLAGKRQRVSVKLASGRLPAALLQCSQAFVITTTYSDPSKKQHSVRRRQRITVDQWQDGLSGSDSVERSPHEGDGTFEERQSIPDECFLARRVISEIAYNAAIKAASAVPIDKYVLSFQVDGGLHYELFYFQGNRCSVVLDFPIGAQLPDWLVPESDDAVAKPYPSEMTSSSVGKAMKTPRLLRRNSTEEAAEDFFRQMRMSTS